MEKPRIQRWWQMVGLLFGIALINYIDRQSLSVVAPKMQAELHLSDAGYAHIVSLFLLASTIAYGLAGFVSDRLGTRRAMALFVGWWSLAEASTFFATSVWALSVARFCLGLGEPGLWVAAPKAVGEIVPKERQGLSISLYTLGATVGAVLALPLIATTTRHLAWRSIFLLDGAVGLLWLPLWFWVSREWPQSKTSSNEVKGGIGTLLKDSSMVRLLLARSLTDPVWYFFLFWFPKYLIDARHLSIEAASRIGWTVYLGAGIGTLLGGIIASWLIRRGKTVRRSYRTTMLYAAMLVPLSPLAAMSRNAGGATLIASVVALAHMAWLVTLTATIVELYPASQVGKVTGLVAMGSGLGGMLSSEMIGYLVMHGGYTPVFWLMGILHPLAITLLWPVFRESVHRERPTALTPSPSAL